MRALVIGRDRNRNLVKEDWVHSVLDTHVGMIIDVKKVGVETYQGRARDGVLWQWHSSWLKILEKEDESPGDRS